VGVVVALLLLQRGPMFQPVVVVVVVDIQESLQVLPLLEHQSQ
jgi:hypothetical protein